MVKPDLTAEMIDTGRRLLDLRDRKCALGQRSRRPEEEMTMTRPARTDPMTRVGMYDQIRKAFQDIIAPELYAIRGDIRVLDQRINGLDSKIDGVEARLATRIGAIDEKIDGVEARLATRIGALDEKIDDVDVRLTTKIDSLRAELVSEIRRVDVRIDGVDRELRIAIDVRERLAALEARCHS
jgi:tetrahydromethanopterin S-methyltransferase subunit G